MEYSTADLVKEELDKDIFLLETLSQGLINHAALARKLLPRIKKKNSKATIESVSVAIMRYANKAKRDDLSRVVKKIISLSNLSIKNDIVHITFPRKDEITEIINENAKKIKWDQDEILLINQGSGEITIVVDKKNKHLFKQILEKAVEIRKNTAIVSIRESQRKDVKPGIDVPGLYAYFINQVSRAGINILDIISTRSQLTFVIDESNLTKCYGVLNDCIRFFR